jgi:hypothetical protein
MIIFTCNYYCKISVFSNLLLIVYKIFYNFTNFNNPKFTAFGFFFQLNAQKFIVKTNMNILQFLSLNSIGHTTKEDLLIEAIYG